LAPGLRRLNSGGESGRAGTYDCNLSFDLFHDYSLRPPLPICVSTFMPFFTDVIQVLVFGLPSTIIMQSVQRPMAQKMPLDWPVLGVFRKDLTPALIRAAATGSPS